MLLLLLLLFEKFIFFGDFGGRVLSLLLLLSLLESFVLWLSESLWSPLPAMACFWQLLPLLPPLMERPLRA